jgi:transketolase
MQRRSHASLLLYAFLYFCGVKAVNPQYETLGELSVTLDDIKTFRQLDSKCLGHPEYRLRSTASGVPMDLGRGDDDVYALCGDGYLMEGVSGEAASLAGPLKLANLCWIYDNNKILDRTKYAPASGVAKGAYVLADADGMPDVLLLASRSEVSLCVAASEQLKADSVKARVW